jgi:hypothetical protein
MNLAQALFPERFIEFLEQREISPLPNPMQLRRLMTARVRMQQLHSKLLEAVATPEPVKTDWFDANTLPVRTGVYELERGFKGLRPTFCKYRVGYGWANYESADIATADEAQRFGEYPLTQRWRGFATPQNGEQA